jgi:hypothetical protein
LFVDGTLAVSASDGTLPGPGSAGMRALDGSVANFQVNPL